MAGNRAEMSSASEWSKQCSRVASVYSAINTASLSAEAEVHRESVLAMLNSMADPFSRTAVVHLTASLLAVAEESHSIALVHHRRFGVWVAPGGHVEESDSTIQGAVIREFREETGARFDPAWLRGVWDIDRHPIPVDPGTRAHDHLDICFLGLCPALPLNPQSDADAAAWLSARDCRMKPIAASLHRSIVALEHARLLR
jgi:8-oxo-dGTP pyrophosphatase MutT (NUDIX family)